MNQHLHVVSQATARPQDYPQTAESILRALESAIDDRTAARFACGELSARKLAILELVRLSGWPDSSEKQQRMAALVEEFGAVDVQRWVRFVERGV